jgi:hypothetical protein
MYIYKYIIIYNVGFLSSKNKIIVNNKLNLDFNKNKYYSLNFKIVVKMESKENVDDSESIASDESEEMTGKFKKINIYIRIEFYIY